MVKGREGEREGEKERGGEGGRGRGEETEKRHQLWSVEKTECVYTVYHEVYGEARHRVHTKTLIILTSSASLFQNIIFFFCT